LPPFELETSFHDEDLRVPNTSLIPNQRTTNSRHLHAISLDIWQLIEPDYQNKDIKRQTLFEILQRRHFSTAADNYKDILHMDGKYQNPLTVSLCRITVQNVLPN